MNKKQAPEIKFQRHIADYFIRKHGYGVLEPSDITDTEHYIAEDQLWAFLCATQADMIQKLVDDYGTDARDEVFRALHQELDRTPLWLILRRGLQVRGLEFKLYYAKPRSTESVATLKYEHNRITFRPHFYFGETNKEIDFVLFLNGLPIVAIEVKHEKNQNVHDAVEQFARRDHSLQIFQHPFLYLAADTCDVMAATDPSRTENFSWHNSGLTNKPQTEGEYPIEYLYRDVLSKEQLLDCLSFFLVYVPKQEATEDELERSAFSILPRYHQSRMVRKISREMESYFSQTGEIGRKFLIEHSAGSGKTLSICWLAERLHSMFKPGTNEKMVDIVFILTDRRSLDKNIREDIEKFTHLKGVVGLAKKAEHLPRFLRERKSIIVTTQQKFVWVLQELENRPELQNLRVAFLIDEAHRSQEGNMSKAIKAPFRQPDEPDAVDAAEDNMDSEEEIDQIIRAHDRNQLFVAFTATPAPATVTLFGTPADTYTEAEAIAEGYIVDVAASIISYKTLYQLHSPVVFHAGEEKLYPKGVVAKALQNFAYQDDGLIQYKAEVMLRIFEQEVKPMIQGRAKSMIVATSRLAGLRYFDIIREKLKERGADYKVLYAFSDFVHPMTNEAISEHTVNGLNDNEQIEDRFAGEDYRLMVVANKFQTGFNEPLLCGMFLDKTVVDRNAVQTLSRLNRCYEDKKGVIVVDFTNNASKIVKAFAKYRAGTPFVPGDPDPEQCRQLSEDVLAQGVFGVQDAERFEQLRHEGTDAQIQSFINELRERFNGWFPSMEIRKEFVYLLAKFVKNYLFLTHFFTYPPEIQRLANFAEYVGPQLIKQGTISDLMKQIRQMEVIKAAVTYKGIVQGGGAVKPRPSHGGNGAAPPLKKVSVQDMIDEIQRKFPISDEEALYIRQVTERKVADTEIRETVQAHSEDLGFLNDAYRVQVNVAIQEDYDSLGRFDELADVKYTDIGGIFDIMAVTVIQSQLVAM
jgi:type I restriction enzyme R subunit